MYKQTSLFETTSLPQPPNSGYDELVRLADAMESTEPGSPERKELNRQYGTVTKALGLHGNKETLGKDYSKIAAESRRQALEKIKTYLDDIVRWEQELPTMAKSELGHIAVSYISSYGGFRCEIQLKIPHAFYRSYSGYAALKTRVSLVIAHQLKGYPSIEYGLIKMGLELSKGPYKKVFFDKYAIPFNKRLAEKRAALKNQDHDDK